MWRHHVASVSAQGTLSSLKALIYPNLYIKLRKGRGMVEQKILDVLCIVRVCEDVEEAKKDARAGGVQGALYG